ELTVIAWLWARTVKCSNPACGAQIPLTRSFTLSTKPGKRVWIKPVIGQDTNSVRFVVHIEGGSPSTGTMKNRAATCVICGATSTLPYVRSEAQSGRMGAVLLAMVAEGSRGRVYLSPLRHHEEIARKTRPKWKPDQKVPTPCHDVDRLPMYGMYTWGD